MRPRRARSELPRGAEHKYLIAFAVVLAALMQVIDSSIVNVALPDFFRQLGGSFGIAAIATLLTHYAAQFRAELAQHVTSGSPAVMARMEAVARGFMAKGTDAAAAHARAIVIDRQVQAQSSVLAYGRIYVLSAILILSLIPLLILVRKTRGE